jgi:hypothetical protein
MAKKRSPARRAKPPKARNPSLVAPVRFLFSGVLEVVQRRGHRTEIRIYASAVEALSAGVARSIVDRIWPPPPKVVPPDCQTFGEWDPKKGNVFVKCVNNDCTTFEGCHLLSWPREGPDDPRDEGYGGQWVEKGRVYQCSCEYSD